jgi:hypothetical protein
MTGRLTSAAPKDGQALDELFDQVESALTQKVAMGTTFDGDGEPDPGRRDVRALSEMYLDYRRLEAGRRLHRQQDVHLEEVDLAHDRIRLGH